MAFSLLKECDSSFEARWKRGLLTASPIFIRDNWRNIESGTSLNPLLRKVWAKLLELQRDGIPSLFRIFSVIVPGFVFGGQIYLQFFDLRMMIGTLERDLYHFVSGLSQSPWRAEWRCRNYQLIGSIQPSKLTFLLDVTSNFRLTRIKRWRDYSHPTWVNFCLTNKLKQTWFPFGLSIEKISGVVDHPR